MKKVCFVAALMMALGVALMGCRSRDGMQANTKGTNVCAVVIGMETSKFAGACPGAGYDADRMYELLKKHTTNAVLLKDDNATKSKVVSALTKAIESAGEGLVIFYYSGHGGSAPFPDTGIEEDDGKDEFLCLWDTRLRDNDIWSIIGKSKGRIMFVVDACHSQSIMRNRGFCLRPPLAWDHEMSLNVSFSLLCWSGCPDNAYSYGSAGGGELTNALLRHYNSKDTYQEMWNKIKGDRLLLSYENPQSTVIGSGFNGKSVFR